MEPYLSGTWVVVYLCGAAVFQALLAVGLFLWGRWVARRRGGRAWRYAAWMPLGALTLSLLGVLVTMVYVLSGFSAIQEVEPAAKATRLAATISEAMNYLVWFILPAWLLYVSSTVTLAVGSCLKSPRVGSSPKDPTRAV